MSTNSSPSQDVGQPVNAAAAQMILQSQALMMQMLDLQKWQQQVALRFVEAHQQMVQCYASGAPLPMLAPAATAFALPQMAAMPVAQAVSAPTPEAVPAAAPTPAALAVAAEPVVARPAPVAVAARPVAANVVPRPVTPVNRLAATPIPVSRTAVPVAQPEPAIQRNGSNGTHAHDVPAPHVLPAAPVARTAPAPATGGGSSSGNGDGIPSTEQFKDDLLQAVSERTGYPIEMLDLELPMESGLGIDSIKTVEIFSNLKTYHPYFRQEDQDEEEVLKEFTKLKTLGDIISAYDLRYQALTSAGAAGTKAADNGAAVERYTLEAVAAAPTSEKKTSLVSR